MVKEKKVLLGVTGSIAAYKATDIVRGLKKMGADVFVVMTESATQFITALTLETLSQNPVHVKLFGENKNWSPLHVDLASSADLILIAPATANTVAKIAHGIADTLLTSVVLASRAPVVIAPAMNASMYTNPIFVANKKKLEKIGYKFVECEEGPLASGEVGVGRLAGAETILNVVKDVLK